MILIVKCFQVQNSTDERSRENVSSSSRESVDENVQQNTNNSSESREVHIFVKIHILIVIL